MPNIRSYRELRVYQHALDAAMMIFEITKMFPADEKYSMTDQMRRSSRAVCSNLAESWRKRKYPAHFVSKLTDSAAEADETRVWLELALRCNYIQNNVFTDMDNRYDMIIAQLVKMMSKPEDWTIK